MSSGTISKTRWSRPLVVIRFPRFALRRRHRSPFDLDDPIAAFATEKGLRFWFRRRRRQTA